MPTQRIEHIGLTRLAEVPCWHLWQAEARHNKAGEIRQTKVPVQAPAWARRRHPGTLVGLTTLADAREALEGLQKALRAGVACGLGIATEACQGVSWLDLDGAYDSEGRPRLWALPVIEACRVAGAYIERSPSGLGLRIGGIAAMAEEPVQGRRRWRPAGVDDVHQGIDLFHGGVGFVTITERAASGSLDADISAIMDNLLRAARETRRIIAMSGGWKPAQDAVRVQTLPALLSVEMARLLLEVLPCEANMGGNDEAVAIYAKLAFAIGRGWDEAQEYVRAWGLQYDGDDRWLDAVLTRISEGGVKVAHAKDLTAWLEESADIEVVKRAIEEIRGASVRNDFAGIEADSAVAVAPSSRVKAEVLEEQRWAARIAVDEEGHRLRWIAERGRWAIHDGKRWRIADEHESYDIVGNVAERFADRFSKASKRKEILSERWINALERMMRKDPRVARPMRMWDVDPFLLMTPAGVVNLYTGEMRAGTLDDLMLNATRVAPAKPGTRAPMWERFLAEAFRGDQEMIRYVQTVFGLALIGMVIEHALFILLGSGGTGKGTLVNTISWVLGDYASPVSPDLLLESRSSRHLTEIASLNGLRLAVAQEVSEGTVFDIARMKRLTGGDPLRARFMARDEFTFEPTHTLVLALNTMPRIQGDEAVRRRLRVIGMNAPPAKDNPQLQTLLRKEGPAILRWLIDGAVAYSSAGALVEPEAVREASQEIVADSDPLGTWFGQEIEITGENADYARPGEMVKRFKGWANSRGERTFMQPDGDIERRIALIAGRDPRVKRMVTTIERKSARVYRGMRMRNVTIDTEDTL